MGRAPHPSMACEKDGHAYCVECKGLPPLLAGYPGAHMGQHPEEFTLPTAADHAMALKVRHNMFAAWMVSRLHGGNPLPARGPVG